MSNSAHNAGLNVSALNAEINTEIAIVNANWLMRRLAKSYDLPYPAHCMHEFVLSGRNLRKHGIKTLDVAKRLLDFGVHAPTVYFPLIVEEALMIEPTETETLDRLEDFAEAMERIAHEAATEPERLTQAPHTTPNARLDEGRAARQRMFDADAAEDRCARLRFRRPWISPVPASLCTCGAP